MFYWMFLPSSFFPFFPFIFIFPLCILLCVYTLKLILKIRVITIMWINKKIVENYAIEEHGSKYRPILRKIKIVWKTASSKINRIENNDN